MCCVYKSEPTASLHPLYIHALVGDIDKLILCKVLIRTMKKKKAQKGRIDIGWCGKRIVFYLQFHVVLYNMFPFVGKKKFSQYFPQRNINKILYPTNPFKDQVQSHNHQETFFNDSNPY